MSNPTYHGSCHCGAVQFSVTMPTPTFGMACNCSICRRAGWLLTFQPQAAFVLESSPEALSDYQFGQHKLHHTFCRTCGVRAFSQGPGHDGSEWVAVNLRCVDGIDLGALEIQTFDGAAL